MDRNPSKALDYARKAAELGDERNATVQAEILDTKDLSDPTHTSSSCVMITSQLLAKLDPAFSQNVRESESLRDLGFIQVIIGYNICIKLLNFSLQNTYSVYQENRHILHHFTSGAWKNFPLDNLRGCLEASRPVCIMCLSDLGVSSVPCSDCDTWVPTMIYLLYFNYIL